MKLMLLIAGLALGGTAATAQTATSSTMPSGEGITRQGTNPEGQPCTPAGFNQGLWVYPACIAMGGPTLGMAEYPPCTRQVTDRCVQLYTKWTDRRRR